MEKKFVDDYRAMYYALRMTRSELQKLEADTRRFYDDEIKRLEKVRDEHVARIRAKIVESGDTVVVVEQREPGKLSPLVESASVAEVVEQVIESLDDVFPTSQVLSGVRRIKGDIATGTILAAVYRLRGNGYIATEKQGRGNRGSTYRKTRKFIESRRGFGTGMAAGEADKQ